MNDPVASRSAISLRDTPKVPPSLTYLAGLAPNSRRAQGHALRTISQLLTGNPDHTAVNWALVGYAQANALRSALAERYAPATANRIMSAFRGVMRAAWLDDLISADDYMRIQQVRAVGGSSLPAGRELAIAEIEALLTACQDDPSPAGPRDASIIGLMYSCGLRRAEVAALNLEDYDADAESLKIRQGKGRKDRLTFTADSGLQAALGDWLQERGGGPGPLFAPVNKSGTIGVGRGISSQAVYLIVKKRGEIAGVTNFSPHDLRRSFVSHLLERGADLSIVAGLAGHSQVTTTARYDRRPDDAKREAATLLRLPYKRRSA